MFDTVSTIFLLLTLNYYMYVCILLCSIKYILYVRIHPKDACLYLTSKYENFAEKILQYSKFMDL